jgi:hypothetical protein
MEKSCFVKNKISYSDSCKYFFTTEIIKIQDFVNIFNVSGGHVFSTDSQISYGSTKCASG